MSQLRFNRFGVFAICALVCAGNGCSVPWAAPFSRQAEPPAVPMATVNRADSSQPGIANSIPSDRPETIRPKDASEPDLSSVLDKIELVRAIDPAAEQQLMAELRKAPADSWPLVAEQFRASLAYREQLASKRRSLEHSTARNDLAVGRDSIDPSPTNLVANSRPSAPIGQLVDPRSADADGISSEALARSTPYSTPAGNHEITKDASFETAPAEFTSDGPSYPIRAQRTADDFPTHDNQSVVQARFQPRESSSEPSAAEPDGTGRHGDRRRGDDWRALVESAAADLSRRAATSPTTTAEVHQHASLRMLHLLAGDTEKALEPIPHISPIEQDYWSRQLFALATYLDHHNQSDDKRRAAASVIHLDQAVSSLRELGALSLRNLSFCKKVYGYGAIELCEYDRFSAGQQVTVYVEVENYRSTPTEKGYRTALGSSYEILTEEGTRVGGGEIPDVEDFCRSRRRDFHIQYGLTLPDTMGLGKHRLQLMIKDRQSDKIGHASAAFEISGAGQ
jgi:hypothetical protein